MAGPILTGYVDPGHRIEFEYSGDGETRTGTACCECGWQQELTAWNKPWGATEFAAVMRRHLAESEASS